MVEVTNELIYETLKQVQVQVDRIDFKIDEIKNELQATRDSIVAVHREACLERIGRRLQLSETITP